MESVLPHMSFLGCSHLTPWPKPGLSLGTSVLCHHVYTYFSLFPQNSLNEYLETWHLRCWHSENKLSTQWENKSNCQALLNRNRYPLSQGTLIWLKRRKTISHCSLYTSLLKPFVTRLT